MTETTETIVEIFSALLQFAMVLIYGFMFGVVFYFIAEYSVNKSRPASYWVEYFEVTPALETFPVGVSPAFKSKSKWHRDVLVQWPDYLLCVASEGPLKDKIVRYSSIKASREMRKPGRTGFYDEHGYLEENSNDGYWTWAGFIPDTPARCWLIAQPVIYPSPLVQKDVPVNQSPDFYFK